jgi:ANTAR domain
VKGGLVSTGSGDEERGWAADKRDFVADRRDEVADERDRVADTRDRTADDREAELDKWERQLDARAAEFGGPTEESGAAEQRTEARAERAQARQNRDEAQAKRTIAAADRAESTKRRQADAPPTRLAMAFADIAEQLYDADSFDDVLSRIAKAAVSTIAGCRMASVTLLKRSEYRTAASTDPAATAVDQAQYQSNEGPCLDAVDAPMVYAQSFPDERWPTLASRPTESGVQSALSYRLAASSGTADSAGGSMNSYGVIPYAFNDTSQEIGLILAAHASVAARAVKERNTLQSLGHDLQQVLLSRDVIGQAKGILIERLKITPEDAFDLLRRSSQNLNVKLRDVARGLAETGEFRMTRTSPRPTSSETVASP